MVTFKIKKRTQRTHSFRKSKMQSSRREHSRRSDRSSRGSGDSSRYSRFNRYDKKRHRRHDDGEDRHRRKRTRRESHRSSTNIVTIGGDIASHIGARDLESAVHSYRPMGFCLIRDGDTLLSHIKYILVHFSSISSAIAFVEDFEYDPSRLLMALTESDGEGVYNGKLLLSYYRMKSDLKDSDPDWKALKSDWICHCGYYNQRSDDDGGTTKDSNDGVSVKCGRADCRATMSSHCVRLDALTGNPYLSGEIIVDKVKGHRINLKSNAVLAVQGIPSNTTEDVLRKDLQCIGPDTTSTFGVYIITASGSSTTTQALLQFMSPEIAKNALKQALMAEVKIAGYPIQMTLIQTPWYRRSMAAAAISRNLLIPKPSDFGIAETFLWDSSANCFYDPGSGYYFDIHRRLYYYQNAYYNWDPETMCYVQVKPPEDEEEDDDDDDPTKSGNDEKKEAMDVESKQTQNGMNGTMSSDSKQEQSGPIKFGFKAPSAPSKDGNTAKSNEQSTTMNGFTAQQAMMISDLPMTLQTKAAKFCNSDNGKFVCYLCRRKFKGLNALNDHINLSPYHLYNLSQWILKKKKEIEAVAAKFYSTIADTGIPNSRKTRKKSQSKEESLQESFLKMMEQHKNSTCDSIGGVRPMMK